MVDDEQFVARHHARVCEIEERRAHRLGAARQDDGVARELGSVVERHLARSRQAAAIRHDLDVPRLEQPRDTVAQLRGDGVFAGHERGEVEAHLAGGDAVLGRPPCLV